MQFDSRNFLAIPFWPPKGDGSPSSFNAVETAIVTWRPCPGDRPVGFKSFKRELYTLLNKRGEPMCDGQGGAGAPQIEITPEMVMAGAERLGEIAEGVDCDYVAEQVYLAMRKVFLERATAETLEVLQRKA